MKKIIILLLLVGGLAAAGFLFLQRTGASKQETEYLYAMVTRGDLETTVSSTGTLSAVGTVEVGSQVSGTIDRILVDYNDKVKKGQLLAVIDTTVLEASVRDAQASVKKVEAQYNQAYTECERYKKLFADGFISELELMTYKTSLEAASSELVSAKEALKKAEANLTYANIRSPISGTVLERSVDAGQTIAASTSTPELFTIAEDLEKMEIEALVDESDIGQIKQDMAVRFTVQAYVDEEFSGTVRQVRLNPTTDEDVVNYTVIVDASNESGMLLPGMTATVDFLVEQRQNVLLVPNTALSFQPSRELMESLRQNMPQMAANNDQADNGQTGMRGPMGSFQAGEGPSNGGTPPSPPQGQDFAGGPPPMGDGQERPERPEGQGQMANGMDRRSMAAGSFSRVFSLDESSGKPVMVPFMAGLTDDVMTEVVQSAQLQEGTRVITGIASSQKKSSEKSGFSFGLPGMGGGGPGGGPPPM